MQIIYDSYFTLPMFVFMISLFILSFKFGKMKKTVIVGFIYFLIFWLALYNAYPEISKYLNV